MKAVRIHEYGDESVLRVEDAPRPVCNAEDVLIRVVGASVNPVDWKIRRGYLKEMIPYAMTSRVSSRRSARRCRASRWAMPCTRGRTSRETARTPSSSR